MCRNFPYEKSVSFNLLCFCSNTNSCVVVRNTRCANLTRTWPDFLLIPHSYLTFCASAFYLSDILRLSDFLRWFHCNLELIVRLQHEIFRGAPCLLQLQKNQSLWNNLNNPHIIPSFIHIVPQQLHCSTCSRYSVREEKEISVERYEAAAL